MLEKKVDDNRRLEQLKRGAGNCMIMVRMELESCTEFML